MQVVRFPQSVRFSLGHHTRRPPFLLQRPELTERPSFDFLFLHQRLQLLDNSQLDFQVLLPFRFRLATLRHTLLAVSLAKRMETLPHSVSVNKSIRRISIRRKDSQRRFVFRFILTLEKLRQILHHLLQRPHRIFVHQFFQLPRHLFARERGKIHSHRLLGRDCLLHNALRRIVFLFHNRQQLILSNHENTHNN